MYFLQSLSRIWEMKQALKYNLPDCNKKISFTKHTLRLLMNKFDKNHDGTLQKNEFTRLSVWLQRRSDEFRNFDRNHNEEMDAREFHKYITRHFSQKLDWVLDKTFLDKRRSQELVDVFTKHNRQGHKHALDFEEFLKIRIFMFNASRSWSEKSEEEYHESRPVHDIVNFTFEDFMRTAMEELM